MTEAADRVVRWWLVRHAPVINPSGCIYGQHDVEADCSELHRFRVLAERLPRRAAWFVTPLSRTRRTAEAILAAGFPEQVAPAIEPGLIEPSVGDWQGLTHDAVRARGDGAGHRFWLAPATVRPPGGESFADVVERVSATLAALSAGHHGRDVVAVCHGGAIRAALAVALGIDPERALPFQIDPLSLTRIDALPDAAGGFAWRVGGVNLPA